MTMTEVKKKLLTMTKTTADMWRAFCRHVTDIENEYFKGQTGERLDRRLRN